jgi:uncharacterized delta-60 repeat protein/uncharacterized repeat protein (TIGR01451 family)
MKKIFFLFVVLIKLNLSIAQPGSLDFSFDIGAGADDQVLTSRIQSDGKIIIGGVFTMFNDTPINRIARLNTDGSLDDSFDIGTGANGLVSIITLQSDGKIIISGGFTEYNGTPINRIARLNSDGTLDNSFDTGTGLNYSVWTTTLQNDGKIIIAGNFTFYNSNSVRGIARLNVDGSLDNSFDPGTGTDAGIGVSALQSDGKIIVGGTFVSYNDIPIRGIARLNTDGSLDSSFGQSVGLNLGWVDAIKLQSDGKIIIGGVFAEYDGIPRNHIARLNADGSLDNSFDPGAGVTGISNFIETINIQSNGKIIIGGSFTEYNNVSRNRIARINADGSLDVFFDIGAGANNNIGISAIQSDGKIIINGYFTEYDGTSRNRIARLHGDKGIHGQVYLDLNENCIRDVGEAGIKGRNLVINPGNIVVQTNAGGAWFIDSLPSGDYTIMADTSGKWQLTCPLIQEFTIVHPDSTTYTPNFGFISTQPCPEPDISVQMPFIRPGFSDQKIYVNACNRQIATDALNNAYIELQLDEQLTVQSATLPYSNLGNNLYRFDVGSLNPGQCIDFNVSCSLSVNAQLNSTLCMEANLFPAEPCIFDTIVTPVAPVGVMPCELPWDRSSLTVRAWCENDSIHFIITNTGELGNGDMLCYSPVRVYMDGQLFFFDSIQLQGQESFTYVFAGTGQTYRLEVDQHPLHPGHSSPNASIELCGGVGNWTPRMITILPQDDADPINDIFCGIVTGSYDPNDKQGFPSGIGEEHFVLPNQDIEYLIRFQNTGTDTAFTVVIRDTLSTDYDIFSVQSGVSSHPYTFKMYGPRVLEWTFNNILLPDSTTNEPGSNGFVTFKVNQNPDLANGTQITNQVGIYFDFNEPIITNTSLHTVDRCFIYAPFHIEKEEYICDTSYLAPNGEIITEAGNYSFQKNVNGCLLDINVQLSFLEEPNRNIVENVCDTYTAPDGQIYTESGTYTARIPNGSGCDSIISIDLSVRHSTRLEENISSCETYIWDVTEETYLTSGLYEAIFTSVNGCDSTIAINLTVTNL